MKQVTHNRVGKLEAIELPEPLAAPGELVIANAASLISAGTEKMVMGQGRQSLISRAREQPEKARRVLEMVKQDGLLDAVRQVRAKLNEPTTMGYSSAGVVIACGSGVQGYRVGDRVASNGPHAGVVAVPVHLCARVPEGVAYDQACYAVVGSIALQGVRRAKAALGETVLVIGLGLVGQLTVMILKASGCRVIATDPDGGKCEQALGLGADLAGPDLDAAQVHDATRGIGADAVILTAATPSNAPIELAAGAARRRGRVVLVGVVGLDLPRDPFYMKEIEFTVSCSYGPGRYDPDYERRGQDYPPGYVRWTEQRNIQQVLDMIAAGQIDPERLTTHRFTVDRADDAYDMIYRGSAPYLGVVLQYPETDPATPTPVVTMSATPKPQGAVGIGVIGAGGFARQTMLPALQQCEHAALRTLASARGLSAKALADTFGFAQAATDDAAVFNDPAVDAVFLLTRHDLHADACIRALRAGKHVFVEKPLGLTCAEVLSVEQALAELSASDAAAPLLMVGFNRRFADAAVRVRQHFEGVQQPLTVSIRFNGGAIPPDHWTQHEAEGGGRIIGEACHAIDLAAYLTQSPPTRVYAQCVGGPHAPAITDDQSFITLQHQNGSISNIAYLAGGDTALPKERVEVLGGGRMAIIDDWREVQLASGGQHQTHKLPGKGHAQEVAAFLQAVREAGPPPIPWPHLRAVSLASVLAVQSLREGTPLVVPGGE